jgi:hypothetical protein
MKGHDKLPTLSSLLTEKAEKPPRAVSVVHVSRSQSTSVTVSRNQQHSEAKVASITVPDKVISLPFSLLLVTNASFSLQKTAIASVAVRHVKSTNVVSADKSKRKHTNIIIQDVPLAQVDYNDVPPISSRESKKAESQPRTVSLVHVSQSQSRPTIVSIDQQLNTNDIRRHSDVVPMHRNTQGKMASVGVPMEVISILFFINIQI